jgi:hypothetical protein
MLTAPAAAAPARVRVSISDDLWGLRVIFGGLPRRPEENSSRQTDGVVSGVLIFFDTRKLPAAPAWRSQGHSPATGLNKRRSTLRAFCPRTLKTGAPRRLVSQQAHPHSRQLEADVAASRSARVRVRIDDDHRAFR